MPYKIQGRIVASDGYPTGNSDVLIKEISPSPASVWADPETGEFVFIASSENALVNVSSNFYKPKTVFAKFLQGDTILEDDGVVIEGKVTPKKDNSLLWLLGITATIGAIAWASGKVDEKQKQKAKPVIKQPKEVVV